MNKKAKKRIFDIVVADMNDGVRDFKNENHIRKLILKQCKMKYTEAEIINTLLKHNKMIKDFRRNIDLSTQNDESFYGLLCGKA